MKPIDIVLIIIITSVITLVIYFGFMKNKGDLCSSCPYAGKSNCHCKTKENSDIENKPTTENTTNINNDEVINTEKINNNNDTSEN